MNEITKFLKTKSKKKKRWGKKLSGAFEQNNWNLLFISLFS